MRLTALHSKLTKTNRQRSANVAHFNPTLHLKGFRWSKGSPRKHGSTSQFPVSTNCPRRRPAEWFITTMVATTLRSSSAPPASRFTGLADRLESLRGYSSASFPKWEWRTRGRKPASYPRHATKAETPPRSARPSGKSRPWPSCGNPTLNFTPSRKRNLGRMTSANTTSTCPPSTTSAYPRLPNPSLPSGTAP